jgi:hypothetical protein
MVVVWVRLDVNPDEDGVTAEWSVQRKRTLSILRVHAASGIRTGCRTLQSLRVHGGETTIAVALQDLSETCLGALCCIARR